eukprot:scaffold1431_cov346-Pavlova_lutheri.AAC.22
MKAVNPSRIILRCDALLPLDPFSTGSKPLPFSCWGRKFLCRDREWIPKRTVGRATPSRAVKKTDVRIPAEARIRSCPFPTPADPEKLGMDPCSSIGRRSVQPRWGALVPLVRRRCFQTQQRAVSSLGRDRRDGVTPSPTTAVVGSVECMRRQHCPPPDTHWWSVRRDGQREERGRLLAALLDS